MASASRRQSINTTDRFDNQCSMLYELIGVVRPGRGVNEIKEIARAAGNVVLSAGGVVRGVTNWGTFLLPYPARKQGAIYHHGHYFIMRFDSSARTQHSVRRTLGLDPRMIKYSVVKMGSKLDEIKDIAGKASWDSNAVEIASKF